MFLLGVIAFFQMTAIPGFLALRYFRVSLESRIQALIYGFVLSLLINYLLVFLFTAVRIYTPVTVYIVLLIEAVLLFNYIYKSGGTVLYVNFRRFFKDIKDFFSANSFTYNFLLVLSMVVIGIFFYIFISRIKAVFYLNDSVLGWNRFALDWFKNGFPVRSAHYPQLIPTNWSLAYMIIRNADIQMAARNIMPFFSIGILSLFLDLGLRKRKAVYLWALVLYGLIILYLYRPVFIAGGYVDIAVSFFSLLSFLVLYESEERTFSMKRCFWSVLFACTAAVTKQSGLFILVIIIAWNLWLMKSFSGVQGAVFQKSPLVKKSKALLIMFLLVCVIVVSWYAYRQVLIIHENERSEIAHVTQFVHHGRNYLERFAYGFNKILHVWGRNDNRPAFFIYPLLFFILFSLFYPRIRYMTLFIVIPFTVIWGFFYSYSYRNLTPAFPFMALAAAFGSYLLLKKLHITGSDGVKQSQLPAQTREHPDSGKGFKLHAAYLVLLVLPLVVLNFTVFKDELLLENQLTQQRHAGDVKLNKKLYGYYEKYGFDGKIYSKYPNVQVLPVLRDYWSEDRYAEDVHYYLYNFDRPRQQTAGIRKKLKSGKYKLLFKHREFLFIKTK